MFNLNQTSVILLIIVVSRERYAFLVSRYQYDHGSYRLWSSQLSQIGVNLVFLDCCYPYISNLISIDWCYSDFHRLATSQFFHTRIISDSNKWCHHGIHLFDLVSFFVSVDCVIFVIVDCLLFILPRVRRRVQLVARELLIRQEHLSSPRTVFSGVSLAQSLMFCVVFFFVNRCFSFCPFYRGHCVVCSFTIWGF